MDKHIRQLDMLRFFHRIWKRQAMVCICLHFMGSFLWSKDLKMENDPHAKLTIDDAKVFQADVVNFGGSINYSGIIRAINRWENEQDIMLKPENFPQIAIYFDAQRAPGLSVHSNLLITLKKFLESRNFGKDQISFVTYHLDNQSRENLEKKLGGAEIMTSVTEGYFHSEWFHESPMPSALGDRAKFLIDYPNEEKTRISMERRSALPACLFTKQVYWINLALAKDDHFLGIDGAVSNVTLNASSNTQRFRNDFTMAPATATEVLAIPEFWEKHLFSAIDLSVMQIAGGPNFDAEFIRDGSVILLSKNPLSADFYAMQIMQQKRKQVNLAERNLQNCKLFQFARQLGLGDAKESILEKLPFR